MNWDVGRDRTHERISQSSAPLNELRRSPSVAAFARSCVFLCIADKDCEDLEKGKVYALLPDARAKRDGYIRVIDESGEDYLYPESLFVALEIPAKAREALIVAS